MSTALHCKRVLMLIKTSALEYDDRLRKEIETLNAAGIQVDVHCLQDNNLAASGHTWGRSDFNAYRLLSRQWLPAHRFVVLHLLEWWLRLRLGVLVGNYDAVWAHDPVLLPLLPTLAKLRRRNRIQRLVWDLHELPPEGLLQRPRLRRLFKHLTSLPDTLICANQPRIDYLRELGALADNTATAVVHNFADTRYSAQAIEPLPADLAQWLAGRRYILLQGGGHRLRHYASVLEACLSDSWPNNTALVVVGKCDEAITTAFRNRQPQHFAERVWLTGMVPQMELTRFADHAALSLILYSDHIPNQRYCEPNRLYQALCRGLPVVVGNNPPMQSVVEQTGAGYVLDDDGSDSVTLAQALDRALRDEHLPVAAAAVKSRFVWEAQNETILATLK